MSIIKTTTYLVIGGGIAGISCIETLQYLIESTNNDHHDNHQRQSPPHDNIILLTESAIIKSITNLVPLGKALTRFDIEERNAQNKFEHCNNIEIIIDQLDEIDTELRCCKTKLGTKINYQFLCLCTGARPKLIQQIPSDCQQYVLGIRDTESVKELQKRIQSNSRRIAIVGNGGIASEIVYELKNIEITWIIKDRFISQTFIDPGAAEFFQHKIQTQSETEETSSERISDDMAGDSSSKSIIKRMRYLEEEHATTSHELLTKNGAALGPDWHSLINFNTSSSSSSSTETNRLPTKLVNIFNNCEIKSMELNKQYKKSPNTTNNDDDNFPLIIELTNNTDRIYCDFVISATGVWPTVNFKCKNDINFNVSNVDGGILIDEMMRTSIPHIFAGGDVCTANWQPSEHWFQMRLWTQARQMGSMAGKSMWATKTQSLSELEQDFSFELFGHVTQLYGYQVVLLGKFNGQGLLSKTTATTTTTTNTPDCEVILRMTANKEYIKYILVDGKLKGAILIGDTGLEETTENLILNQLDLTAYGDDILNPDIDIEDYFD